MGSTPARYTSQSQALREVGDLTNYFEVAVADEPLFVKRVVKAHMIILRQLEQPEFSIHLLDDVFNYIEGAFLYASDEVSKEWVRRRSVELVRALISFQHAFVLAAYQREDEKVREILREGMEILLESLTSSLGAGEVNVGAIVTGLASSMVKRPGFFEKIFSLFSGKKQYRRKRKQLVWALRRMLEKIEREQNLFAHTFTFAETIQTSVGLLEKYEREIWEEEGYLPGRHMLRSIQDLLSRLLIWGVVGLLVLGFSSLCLLLSSKELASELWKWFKIVGEILFGIGIMEVLLSAFGTEVLRLIREISFRRFKRRMLRMAAKVEEVARSKH